MSSALQLQHHFHDPKALEKGDGVNPAIYETIGFCLAGKLATNVNVECHFDFLLLPCDVRSWVKPFFPISVRVRAMGVPSFK
jgi:hypothetical protein